MILIDANLLIYAYNAGASQHIRARRWLEEVFSVPEPAGLSWLSVLAFLRLVTNYRVVPRPYSIEEAAGIVNEWLELPQISILQPGAQHWTILSRLLQSHALRGPLVSDAHMAALAIEHGAQLCTSDRDFSRFSELKVRNPLGW